MHPLEHTFYFTCYAPCLFMCWHPLILFWMGVHVVLSPAASHSGYEDHFSADLVHYLHHRHTDCNYGVPQSIPFDVWFGSYRGQLYSSSGDDNHKTKSATVDPKARLGLIPDHPIFNLSWGFLWCGVWYFRSTTFATWHLIGAMLVTLGPVWLAWLSWWESSLRMTTRQRSFLAPFDKDPIWSRVLHLSAGVILGVLPATYLVYLTLL
jgi:hypothetical protein